MKPELLTDISRALDEKFYREQDIALLAYLRSQADDDNRRAQIAEIAQIDDAAVLDSLRYRRVIYCTRLVSASSRGLGRWDCFRS